MIWIYVWLAVLAVSLIIEFVTMELVSVWVALGSFVAMILALCGVQIEIQIVVFVVVSIACILGLRRVTLRLLNKNKGKTNLDAVIGTQHKLLKAITEDEIGKVKVYGVEWSVKSENSEPIEVGELVEIIEVDGNKFIVKKVSNEVKKESKVKQNSSLKNENQNIENKQKIFEREDLKEEKADIKTTNKSSKSKKGQTQTKTKLPKNNNVN